MFKKSLISFLIVLLGPLVSAEAQETSGPPLSQNLDFWGRQQIIGINVYGSSIADVNSVYYYDPQLFGSDWKMLVNLFETDRSTDEYLSDKTGAGIRFTHGITENIYGSFAYSYYELETNLTGPYRDISVFPDVTVNHFTNSISTSISHDTRDKRTFTQSGSFLSLDFENGIANGSSSGEDFYKLGANIRYFTKLTDNLVLRNNLTYGSVWGGFADKNPPFTERYLLGGANSLRGYDFGTVGKRKFSPVAQAQNIGDPDVDKKSLLSFGGLQQLFLNLELEMPFSRRHRLMGVAFYDIGDAQDDFELSEFRSNYGLGVRWASPIGMLRFEYGMPIDGEEVYGEDSPHFSFSVQTNFDAPF